jgi:hypothetical protein
LPPIGDTAGTSAAFIGPTQPKARRTRGKSLLLDNDEKTAWRIDISLSVLKLI